MNPFFNNANKLDRIHSIAYPLSFNENFRPTSPTFTVKARGPPVYKQNKSRPAETTAWDPFHKM